MPQVCRFQYYRGIKTALHIAKPRTAIWAPGLINKKREGDLRNEEQRCRLDETRRDEREDDDGGAEDGRQGEADAVAQQRDEQG